MNVLLRAVPIAALTLLAACETVQTTEAGAVGVTRKQQVSSVVSAKEVEAAADKQYDEMMAEAQKKGLLNRNAQQVQRVRAIAQRLIPQTRVFRQDAPGWAWEVNVLTSKGRQRVGDARRQDGGLHRSDRAPECDGRRACGGDGP